MNQLRIGPPAATTTNHTDTDVAAGTASTDTSDSLLSEPVNAVALDGDPFAELAALLSLSHTRDKDASRAFQAAENIAEEHEDAARVQALYDKASHTRANGWAEGAAAIASGLCSFGGGVTTQHEGKLDLNDVFVASARAFDAAKGIIGQEVGASIVEDDAHGETHAAASKRIDHLVGRAHDEETDARDALRKVAEFLQAVRGAQNSALMAAAGSRG